MKVYFQTACPEKNQIITIITSILLSEKLKKCVKSRPTFFLCKDRIALKVISLEPPCDKLSKNIWFFYVTFRRTQVINDKKSIFVGRPSVPYAYTFLLINHGDNITWIRTTYWRSLVFYKSILQYCLPQKCVYGHITYALIIIVV